MSPKKGRKELKAFRIDDEGDILGVWFAFSREDALKRLYEDNGGCYWKKEDLSVTEIPLDLEDEDLYFEED